MDNPRAKPLKTGFSYFGVRRPEHVRRDMAEMRAEGNTHVLHTWSEDDLAYYADTMGRIIEISREEGLEVYVNPWGVGRVFGGEALSELVAKNPGSSQVDSLGHPVAAICPNHPAFVEYMDKWVEAVCSTAVETIFWDEPHFHFRKSDLGIWACRCPACLSGYRERFGTEMPALQDESVRTFREEGLRRFLARMFERVDALGKRNCVCLLPDTFPAGIHDWSTIASLPGLHEISTDPYWEAGATAAEVEETYRRYSLRTVELAKAYGLESQMWIKNYRIGRGEEELCRIATRIAFESGIRNLFAWSWRASEWLSWLRSENPGQVHAAQLEAFARCR